MLSRMKTPQEMRIGGAEIDADCSGNEPAEMEDFSADDTFAEEGAESGFGGDAKQKAAKLPRRLFCSQRWLYSSNEDEENQFNSKERYENDIF